MMEDIEDALRSAYHSGSDFKQMVLESFKLENGNIVKISHNMREVVKGICEGTMKLNDQDSECLTVICAFLKSKRCATQYPEKMFRAIIAQLQKKIGTMAEGDIYFAPILHGWVDENPPNPNLKSVIARAIHAAYACGLGITENETARNSTANGTNQGGTSIIALYRTLGFNDLFKEKAMEKAEKAGEEKKVSEKSEISAMDPSTGKTVIYKFADSVICEKNERMTIPDSALTGNGPREILVKAIRHVNGILVTSGIAISVRLIDAPDAVNLTFKNAAKKAFEIERTNGLERIIPGITREYALNVKSDEIKGVGKAETDMVYCAEKILYVYHIACMLLRSIYANQGHVPACMVSPDVFYVRPMDLKSSRGFQLFVSALGWDLVSGEELEKIRKANEKIDIAEHLKAMIATNYESMCRHFKEIIGTNFLGKYFDGTSTDDNDMTKFLNGLLGRKTATGIMGNGPTPPILSLTDFAPSARYDNDTEHNGDMKKMKAVWGDMAVCMLRHMSSIPKLLQETIDDHSVYTMPNDKVRELMGIERSTTDGKMIDG
jgi:hypothetical protein